MKKDNLFSQTTILGLTDAYDFNTVCREIGQRSKSRCRHLCVVSEKLFWSNLKVKWRRQWQPTPVLLPGKSHGWRSLVGCSPWGQEEVDMTERLHFHFSLSCIGEGNGNPFQCLAWRIPGVEEPGGLPSMGSHRVGHDWSDLAAAKAAKLNRLCKLNKHYNRQYEASV